MSGNEHTNLSTYTLKDVGSPGRAGILESLIVAFEYLKLGNKRMIYSFNVVLGHCSASAPKNPLGLCPVWDITIH